MKLFSALVLTAFALPAFAKTSATVDTMVCTGSTVNGRDLVLKYAQERETSKVDWMKISLDGGQVGSFKDVERQIDPTLADASSLVAKTSKGDVKLFFPEQDDADVVSAQATFHLKHKPFDLSVEDVTVNCEFAP